jgi:cytosine/adenosine deaminase-related metal-dependent hydrolase
MFRRLAEHREAVPCARLHTAKGISAGGSTYTAAVIQQSESTLRSAAPSLEDDLDINGSSLVLGGGTLVDLHPVRVTQADILIRGDAIVQVGGTMPDRVPRLDVSDCIVTPAFTVAHTHAYMALALGMPPPGTAPRSLTDHLQSVWWRLDKALDEELVYTSAVACAAMAAKAGAACVVDLHSSVRAIDGALDHVEAAFSGVGIRGVLAYETSDREGRARRDAGLRENERFLKRVRAGETAHRALVGAHSMFTLGEDTLEALRGLADTYGVGFHMHLAEDAMDARDAERNKRTTLEARVRRLGLARQHSVVAHALQASADLVQHLLAGGATIATTPRSNIAHGLGTFMGSGERVAFGTDGLDGDVLAEARALGSTRTAGARIAAGQVFTSRLFQDGAPPRVVPGARADLALLDYLPLTPMTASNVLDHLVRAWSGHHVRHTIVGGTFIVRDRELMLVDERELYARTRPAAARLWERMLG